VEGLKDVTSTTFGLVIAFLLPGLASLYAFSFWSKRVAELFATLAGPSATGGLYLLAVLTATVAGLQMSAIRYLIFECCLCRSLKLTPADFESLSGEGKLVAFRSAVDDFYRYHQFWGAMAVIQLPLFYGWISTQTGGKLPLWLSYVIAALIEIITIVAAIESYKRYVFRSRVILKGGENA
jgi:hypothetical protein